MNAERVQRCGVGLRRPHFDLVFDRHDGVDFFEVISENFMNFGGRPRAVLDRVVEKFPVVLHGVSLSIGGLDPLDEDYLTRLRDITRRVDTPWFSDHLCWSSHAGVHHHDLLPLPFTAEAIEHLVPRIQHAQERVGRPFLVENPSYYAVMPGAEMSEAEFIGEVVRRSGCGLLLDINNVWVNAVNHGYDARAFIDAMPAGAVRQYHIAGHDASGPFLVDTHGSHIIPPVFELYEYTLRRLGPAWTLLEWDHDIPPWETLLAENEFVRVATRRALGDNAFAAVT